MAGPPEEGGNRREGGGTRPGDIFDAQDLKALQASWLSTLVSSDDTARGAANLNPELAGTAAMHQARAPYPVKALLTNCSS
jgi:hypothetical protein